MLIQKPISLRFLKKSDLEFLYKIENDKSLWRYGGEKKTYTRDELLTYIENSDISIKNIKQFRFVIDYSDLPIGFIDLYDYNITEVSVGIIIDEKYRSRGFAKKSINLIIKYCFNILCVKKLNSCVESSNIISNNLFISSGFKLTKNKNNFNFYTFVK